MLSFVELLSVRDARRVVALRIVRLESPPVSIPRLDLSASSLHRYNRQWRRATARRSLVLLAFESWIRSVCSSRFQSVEDSIVDYTPLVRWRRERCCNLRRRLSSLLTREFDESEDEVCPVGLLRAVRDAREAILDERRCRSSTCTRRSSRTFVDRSHEEESNARTLELLGRCREEIPRIPRRHTKRRSPASCPDRSRERTDRHWWCRTDDRRESPGTSDDRRRRRRCVRRWFLSFDLFCPLTKSLKVAHRTREKEISLSADEERRILRRHSRRRRLSFADRLDIWNSTNECRVESIRSSSTTDVPERIDRVLPNRNRQRRERIHRSTRLDASISSEYTSNEQKRSTNPFQRSLIYPDVDTRSSQTWDRTRIPFGEENEKTYPNWFRQVWAWQNPRHRLSCPRLELPGRTIEKKWIISFVGSYFRTGQTPRSTSNDDQIVIVRV